MIEVQVEVDTKLKEAAESIFQEQYGLSVEQACVLFLEECAHRKELPFSVTD